MLYTIKVAFFSILTLLTFIFIKDENNIFIILSLILLMMYLSDTSKSIYFYILSSIIGATTEAIIMFFTNNIWSYKNPNIMGIPYWLIPLWGIVAGGIMSINEIVNTTKAIKNINFSFKVR